MKSINHHRDPADAWFTASDGQKYWGLSGAAGVLAFDPRRNAILLQHRVSWSDHGDTWGIPGGARHENEDAVVAAEREAFEEAAVPAEDLQLRYIHVLDRGGWTYTTALSEVLRTFEPAITDPESLALEWVRVDDVDSLPLHPGFAASWTLLRPLLRRPILITDRRSEASLTALSLRSTHQRGLPPMAERGVELPARVFTTAAGVCAVFPDVQVVDDVTNAAKRFEEATLVEADVLVVSSDPVLKSLSQTFGFEAISVTDLNKNASSDE